jgi:PAS domain S-box-containing protein
MSTELDQNNLYRQLVERAPDAILFADREGIIRLWNSGAEAIFGWTAEQALGQPLDLIVPEKLRARHGEGYERVMGGAESQYGSRLLAVPALRQEGGPISSEFSMVLVRDEAGGVLGIAAILRDVSERWQREKALKDRLAALEGQSGKTS